MSAHIAKLSWERKTPGFTYDTYDRTHQLTFGGGAVLEASAAAGYRGVSALPNPEEMLVGALSSCHMLTFLAIAARKRLVVDAYTDDAVGYLTEKEPGKLFISKVTLRPKVSFADPQPLELIAELHRQSHEECFIANSVVAEIEVKID